MDFLANHSGVLITGVFALIGMWLSHRHGFKQGVREERRLHLDERRASPAVGSRAKLVIVNDGAWFPRYVRMSLNNDGDLAASKLNGNWTVFYDGREYPRVICADRLPKCEPFEAEHKIEPAGGLKGPIRVKIEFSYLGIDDVPQRYSATYETDPNLQELIQTE